MPSNYTRSFAYDGSLMQSSYATRLRKPVELNLVPMIEGRSSVGRLGLFVHVTAGFGDVGFCGHWTLEMFAVQPVRIYAGVPICQIFYHQIEGEFTEYASNTDAARTYRALAKEVVELGTA